MGNCHSRWNGVRVDNDIGSKTFSAERHILLSICNTDCTLLTVTRSKLVTNLRNLGCSYSDLDVLDVIGVDCQNDLINDTVLSTSQWCRDITTLVRLSSCAKVLIFLVDGCSLADNDIFT